VLLDILARRPVVGMVFGQLITAPEAERLKEKFKWGIAQAIGVKPEHIRQEVVDRWALHWMRAMIEPAYWKEYGLI
jgi:hypothetical protein